MVQFDETELEEDIAGKVGRITIFDFSACVVLHKVIKRSRLFVLLASPWLNVMRAILMNCAVNFALWRGAMTIIQVIQYSTLFHHLFKGDVGIPCGSDTLRSPL